VTTEGGAQSETESSQADLFKRVAPLVAAMAVAGGCLTAWCWSYAPLSTASTVPFGVLLGLFFIAEVCVLHVYVQRQAHTFSLSEVPLVLGLVFVMPSHLILARLLGSAIALLAVRRQVPVKALFNMSWFLLDSAIVVVVYHAALGGTPPLEPRGWLALSVAMASSLLVGSIAISLAITAVEGTRAHPWHSVRWIGLVTTLVSADLGLVTVAALTAAPQTAWLLAVAGVTLFLGYRAHAQLRQSNQGLTQLYSSSRTLASSLPAGRVTEGILEQACDLLRTQIAELAVCESGGEWRCTTLRDGVITVELGRGRDDGIVADLDLGSEEGTLRVANRLSDVDPFSEADVRLLETFTNHASVAIRNQRLVEDLLKEASQRHHEALHDALTGLPNRTLLHQHLAGALAATADGQVAVMLIDLDGFKEVNDTLGHQYGDQLLQEVAARVVEVLGDRGFVSRLGGDEFAVVMSGIDVTAVRELAEKVEHRVLQPFELADLVFEVGASIGIAIAPDDGRDAQTLVQRADVAMYAAKRSGRSVEVYSADADTYTPQRLALAAELRRTIERGELLVVYQPKVALASGDVVGVEALARWHHPDRGFISPDTFIEVAESAGLMRPLAQHMLTVSLRQLAQWRAMGLDLSVAVNLSARNLMDDTLPALIETTLRDTGVPPSALTLEITESTLIVDPARTVGVLNRLSGMGVSIAIDDFGTGYSSLSYLHRLPVDEIKIDKSFVTTMLVDKGDSVIVRSTIELGHNLGLQVTAEGVEDGTTWQLLRVAGCDQAQGYHLCSPCPGAQLTRWLRARHAEQEDLKAMLHPSPSLSTPTNSGPLSTP
jgi:diguanylate cyclase (GGDEF)-like protein